MTECESCSSAAPLYDQGTVELYTADHDQVRAYPYKSKEELFHLLKRLQAEEEGRLVRVTGESDPYRSRTAFLPVHYYMQRLDHSDMVSLISARQFTSHMQPIYEASGGSVYGYEFLLRPLPEGPEFKPYELFETARRTGLHSFLDRQARISAIEVGAALVPRGRKRFINFLPSSIYNPDYCLSHTFAAIKRLEQDPADFVFEVVETEKVEDVEHLKRVFRVYQDNGVQVALDDVGQGHSTLALLKELKPDFIKLDRSLVDGCHQSLEQQGKIGAIQSLAEAYGGMVLAEGIEKAEEWEFCKNAGIQLGQGYLFGRPSPAPVEPNS
ncbi:EAL domain-containing protein [Paenibacillus sambharensis]|uniref:EAL domain-containing protein n=1 Tax=Paenibacillus sambharensis TaxID=1803190 RepID=A0A2W1LI86_9BACL|nr:EAL domain-containing protein [Paenibacillus sambharensis]PZD94244.1 EAL domain-containing protein [Paenibacillus sambharensis]